MSRLLPGLDEWTPAVEVGPPRKKAPDYVFQNPVLYYDRQSASLMLMFTWYSLFSLAETM
jgi:hypothetical protein